MNLSLGKGRKETERRKKSKEELWRGVEEFGLITRIVNSFDAHVAMLRCDV